MGYDAKGDGFISFKKGTDEEVVKKVAEQMKEINENVGFGDNSIDFYSWGRYNEDYIYEILRNVENIAKDSINEAEITYEGEDGCLWRFIFRGGRFVEENGHVEYCDISSDRLIDIIGRYVDNDLCAAEPDYVREVLRDVCGLTDAEIKALGFGYLFDVEAEE